MHCYVTVVKLNKSHDLLHSITLVICLPLCETGHVILDINYGQASQSLGHNVSLSTTRGLGIKFHVTIQKEGEYTYIHKYFILMNAMSIATDSRFLSIVIWPSYIWGERKCNQADKNFTETDCKTLSWHFQSIQQHNAKANNELSCRNPGQCTKAKPPKAHNLLFSITGVIH